MMMEHRLIGDTLNIERDENGKTKGIIGRCTCGWTTGYRFSSALASVAFQNHKEKPRESRETR